jgi:hypothetical protein
MARAKGSINGAFMTVLVKARRDAGKRHLGN